jgi:hypothetical protein
MKPSVCWVVRISWAMLGGACGTWLGLSGYLQLPHNADSFGSLIAKGVFGMFAWVGLLLGMACGALIGGLVEALLRRLGAGLAAASSVATVVNALALWLLVGAVQAAYPGLGGGGRQKQEERPAQSVGKPAAQSTCANSSPTDPRERKIWDIECR